MDREERRRQERERRRIEEERQLLREIKAYPEHPLSLLNRQIIVQKSHLLEDETDLIEREAELERFQPMINKMKGQKQPPYNYHESIQSSGYYKYKEYVAEKNRLEGNVEFVKRNITERKDRIKELESQIQALETYPGQEERDERMREGFLHDDKDINTIDSGNIFEKASKRDRTHHHSRQRQELPPLQKLSTQGEGFRRMFTRLTQGFQGQHDAKLRLGYPVKPDGGRKTKKRYKYGTRKFTRTI